MQTNYNKLISLGAIVALIGYVMSSPVAFLIVRIIHPQPAWVSPEIFAKNYHVIQDIPFYFGFLLIGGMLMLSAGHYLNYGETNHEKKFYLLISLGWTIVFCALISFNYICQVTFVRNLALHYKPEYDFAISSFSMSNPMSFCWANEMWGYGFLGIATWLMSGYYRNKNNSIRILLITNGVVSLLTALLTIVDINWVMTIAGLISYFTWNALMIILMVLIYRNAGKSLLKSSNR
jgi:hypothetical protein